MIGFSLPYACLGNKSSGERQHKLLLQYGSLKNILHHLKQAGVTSVEIRALSRKANSTQIQNSIQMIWEMGFSLTIHGALEGNFTGQHFVEVYPSMEYILSHFSRYQSELMITVHALQDIASPEKKPDAVIGRLAERTIHQLAEWSAIIASEQLPIRFALELNRYKPPVIDPGSSIEGVLQMVEAIHQSNVGICWDMGHYYSNILTQYNQPSPPDSWVKVLPPDPFLQRVIHTHIHGLHGKDDTHFPLTAKPSLPLEHYIQSLQRARFQGVYNLELSCHQWSADCIEEGILSSIERLGGALSQ